MKFYGQNYQDKFIFERYFKDKKNGISIECGALDGLLESSTYFFEETLGWSTINIEVCPPLFEMLNNNRKDSININKGLSNKINSLTFRHVIHPNHGTRFGNGSFNHHDSHKEELISQSCEFKDYEVETTTYKELIDKIMDKNFKNKKVNLFVLDVEGFELEVIEGMNQSNYLPEIMCVEYPYTGLDALKSRIIDMDYSFDTIEHNNAFFIKNDTNI